MLDRRRFAVAAALAFAACADRPEPRPDPRLENAPVANAWMTVGLTVTGPDATKDKQARCIEVATRLNISVLPQAPVRAVLTLASPNRITIVAPDGRVLRDEEKGGWMMELLCANALSMAADESGHRVMVSKGEPVGGDCVMRGGIDGPFGGDYNAAVGNLKLIAAQKGMNYVVLDAMTGGYGYGAMARLSGRGYTCSSMPSGEQRSITGGAGGCVPDCSPGFVCYQGQCISACNPPCAAGQQCGGDRLCH